MTRTYEDIHADRAERPPHSPAGSPGRDTQHLLRDLTLETVTLLRQEVALAKQEMTEKAKKTARNTGYIAAGGLVAWAGVMILLLAATAGLYVGLALVVAWYTALWLSPLIVGAVVAIVGWIMIAKGKRTIAHQHLAPEKTIESMRENKQWLRNEMH